MRHYNSETDYPLLLAAVRESDDTLPLSQVCYALRTKGIDCFGYALYRDQWTFDFDRDIQRAWAESGKKKIA